MNKAGSIWYAVGALVMIAGVVASIAGVISDFRSVQGAFVRFIVPGSSDLEISRPGPYIINYEYHSVVNGEIFQTTETTDIKCTVVDRHGRPVAIEPVGFTAEYDFGGRAGKAIAQFTAPAIGTYVISCVHPAGKGDRIVLAITTQPAADFIVSFFKWLAIAFASIGVGLIILIVTLVRRAGPGPKPTLS